VTDVEVQPATVLASTPPQPIRQAAPPWVRTAYAGALGGGILIAAAAALHVWFAPFVVGVAIGALAGMSRVRARAAVLPTVVAAVGGWMIPLLWRAIEGQPVVATARVVAALAGLPPTGWLVIGVCLIIAAVQGLLGVWWARSLTGLLVARQHRAQTRAADAG
jgi:hypothetical protein